ncbi:hypothetical protein [Achromobacter sp. DH1f]|uniref:hypothetical protein n=1 Tax=Achromobacter sp. DH1f TaxID=1397275 RepID=UPI0004682EE2|nr:hypothetical protein [Achromobacter sp. DH1f]
MTLITTIEEAKEVLTLDRTYMIRMDVRFACWIQVGEVHEEGSLVASGRKVAQISQDVFHALIPLMDDDQPFCSEYRQRHAGGCPGVQNTTIQLGGLHETKR